MKTKNILKGIFSLLIIVNLISCDDSTEIAPDLDQEIIEEYLNQKGLTAERDSNGIYFIRNIENPAGERIEQTNVVTIYFRLLSLEENIIEEYSASDGDPIKFMHGVNSVFPKGLDLGLKQMREGENFTFIIPSLHAYGSNALPTFGIEANTPVIMEVEVVEVWTIQEYAIFEDQQITAFIAVTAPGLFTAFQSGLYKRLLSAGNGELPQPEDFVTVDFIGEFLGGEEFDRGNISFFIGDGTVVAGFDEGVRNSEYGEKAIIILPSHMAYGESNLVIPLTLNPPRFPPFSIIQFEIELRL